MLDPYMLNTSQLLSFLFDRCFEDNSGVNKEISYKSTYKLVTSVLSPISGMTSSYSYSFVGPLSPSNIQQKYQQNQCFWNLWGNSSKSLPMKGIFDNPQLHIASFQLQKLSRFDPTNQPVPPALSALHHLWQKILRGPTCRVLCFNDRSVFGDEESQELWLVIICIPKQTSKWCQERTLMTHDTKHFFESG